MTDEQRTQPSTQTAPVGQEAKDATAAADASEAAQPVPTPEELLAETEADDPDVGIDGTGVGELP
jgi:hypothetical protein